MNSVDIWWIIVEKMKNKTYLEQLDYPTRAIRIYTNCTVENKKKVKRRHYIAIMTSN